LGGVGLYIVGVCDWFGGDALIILNMVEIDQL